MEVMKIPPYISLTLCAALLAPGAAAAAAPSQDAYGKITDASFLADLQKIETTAAAIADGRDGTGQKLLGPARDIALAWGRVAPVVAKDGLLAEESIANRSIDTFESEWKTSKDPRSDANEITGAIGPIFAHTPGSVPADTHRLAYLARAIKLDVAGKDWNGAASDADDLGSTWQGVRDDLSRADTAAAAPIGTTVSVAQQAVKSHDGGKAASAADRLATQVNAALKRS
jgi:hypothetical protein